MLNEYTNHPTDVQIGFVEANTPQEAAKLASLYYPNRGPLKVVPSNVILENNSVDSILE